MKLISILLILIVLLFFYYYRNISYFSIIPIDYGIENTNDITEIYHYPCSGCLGFTGEAKPYSMYNLSDDRCLWNNSYEYIPNSIDNIHNYTLNPENLYSSCTGLWNTMYSDVDCRYIRIIRNDSLTTPLSFSHISFYTKIGDVINDTNMYIYASNSTIDPYITLNSINPQSITYTTGTNSYIHIDLGSTYTLGYIIIIHNDELSSNSLKGTTINIYKDNSNNVGKIVFSINIIDNPLTRIIYTQNYTNINKIDTMINNFQYPCINCYNRINNTLYNNNRYSFYDTRCITPVSNQITLTDLNIVYNLADISTITNNIDLFNKFQSCYSTYDSRVVLSNLIMVFNANTFDRFYDINNNLITSVGNTQVRKIITDYPDKIDKSHTTFKAQTNTGCTIVICSYLNSAGTKQYLSYNALKLVQATFTTNSSFSLLDKTIYISIHPIYGEPVAYNISFTFLPFLTIIFSQYPVTANSHADVIINDVRKYSIVSNFNSTNKIYMAVSYVSPNVLVVGYNSRIGTFQEYTLNAPVKQLYTTTVPSISGTGEIVEFRLYNSAHTISTMKSNINKMMV